MVGPCLPPHSLFWLLEKWFFNHRLFYQEESRIVANIGCPFQQNFKEGITNEEEAQNDHELLMFMWIPTQAKVQHPCPITPHLAESAQGGERMGEGKEECFVPESSSCLWQLLDVPLGWWVQTPILTISIRNPPISQNWPN